MSSRASYPKILKAVQESQRSVWAIVDAILEEAERSKAGNRMKDGEADRISDYLRRNGQRMSVTRIRHLYTVGWWVKDHPRFRDYSVTRVIHVMGRHRTDYQQAARVIRSDVSSRTLKGETMKPLTAIHRASGYLTSAARTLEKARYTDEEWDELQVAADEVAALAKQVQGLIRGDFTKAVTELRPRRRTSATG